MSTNAPNNPESGYSRRYLIVFELEMLKPPPECWVLSADIVRQTLRQLFENDSLRVNEVHVRLEKNDGYGDVSPT